MTRRPEDASSGAFSIYLASIMQPKVYLIKRGLVVLEAKSLLSNSSAKRRREVVIRKGLREDRTTHPQKTRATKGQKREARIPEEYRLSR
jgi:hypothetical protein